MTVSAGTRLGPYEVLSPLGAGGMGEVYKAKDTRLERTVAVKVLPSHLSASAEVRQRFEREAKTISQLSHPHICALYDVGNQDGVEYLVMEYLEGETLADRLLKGPLPTEQTLRYGIEIADALDKAHRQGIVHRDLKPGNVMLTKSGVKLLDFGLAKAVAPATQLSGMTALPTMAPSPLTQEGTILGTFQYMSPEQLEGREADVRSDIFAFGAVLYEMATGKKAFSGASQASLISAIMKEEPAPIPALAPMAPRALDRVVRTCLAKDPEDRWQSARDLGAELKWIAGGGSDITGAVAADPPRRRGALLLRALAAAAVLLALAEGVALLRRPATAPRPLNLSLLPPEGWTFDPLSGPMTFSPDGSRVVFAARDAAGRSLLWVRSLDSPEPVLLAETEGARNPFWSPDGRSVGFESPNAGLCVVPVSGGALERIVPTGPGRGATWNRDGVILFSPSLLSPIYRVTLADRRRVAVTTLDQKRGESVHQWPYFLPDGRHFLFVVQRVDPNSRRSESEIYVQELGSSEKKLLLRAGSRTIYVPPGYLVYASNGGLVAQPFDAKSATLTGDALVVTRRVQFLADSNTGIFSASNDGLLAYAEGGTIGLAQLTVLDRNGKEVGTVGAQGNLWTPRLSADGRRVAAESIDPVSNNRDVWIFDLAGGEPPARVTFDPGEDFTPVFSPDGARIAFSSLRKGVWSIFVKSLAGSEEEQAIATLPGSTFLTDWSRDGRLIAFNRSSAETSDDMWLLSVPERRPRPYLATPASERDTAISPDGRWAAHISAESGRSEVYVRAFPGPGGKWQISTAGGLQPRWRPDGKELFYVAPGGWLTAVPVKTEPVFEKGAPQPLFQVWSRRTNIAQYDVFPDGQRFLVNTVVTEKSFSAVRLLQNWSAALKK